MTVFDKKKVRYILKWILWAFVIQFVLLNISGMLYGYKLTHFYEPSLKPATLSAKDIFTKTWKLFRGPKFQKIPTTEIPHVPFQTVPLKTKEGHLIEGWYIPTDSSRGTVILVHGLGVNKSFLLDEAYELRYLGFNLMMIDLRAHGNSTGNTTTLGVREAEEVKMAYDYISKRGEKKILLYGVSLGAVVIAKAVSDFDLRPAGIVLDMPFENLKKLFEGRARMLGFPEEPFGMLVTFWSGIERGFNGFKHNTSKYAQKINCPVLMEYGVLDKLVTSEEASSIFNNIASPNKKLVIFKNAGHNSFVRSDADLWRNEMSEFLLK